MIRWTSEVEIDPDILEALEEGDPNPLVTLRSSLEALVASLGTVPGELQESMQRTSKTVDCDGMLIYSTGGWAVERCA